MRARWMLVLAIAVVLGAWFFAQSLQTRNAVGHAADAQPMSTASSADVAQLPAPVQRVAQADARAPVASDPSGESETNAVDSQPTGPRLYGFVLPVAGTDRLARPVTVGLTNKFNVKRFVEVGPDGAYSFVIETTGRYWVVAESIVAGEVRRTIDFDVAAGDQRLDLPLEVPLKIKVEVVDSLGVAVRGLELFAVATSETPGERVVLPTGISGTNFGVGVWTEELHPAGTNSDPIYGSVRLLMPPPISISLVYLQHVLATQRVEVGQTSVRFVLDSAAKLLKPGRLLLRLIDARTLQPLQLDLQLFDHAGVHLLSTGRDGSCTGVFAPGWLGVRLQARNYASLEMDVRIDPDALTNLGDIALGPPLFISGVVVDEHGRGVATSLFFDAIEPANAAPMNSRFLRSVRSSPSGAFHIGDLSRCRYKLRVDDRDSEYGIQSVDVDASLGSVEGVRIELETGIPLALRASDDRWPLVSYSVINDQGVKLRSSRLFGPDPQEILLAPGQYDIEVRIGESSETVRHAITIANDPVDLSLP